MTHDITTKNHFDSLLDALIADGYAVVPQFFSIEETQRLAQRARELQQADLLHQATTGKNPRLDNTIRGDATYWLDENSAHPAEMHYLQIMQQLRQMLNRHLYLGLHALESHFALYTVGAFYQKHLDQFISDVYKQGDVRQVSCILYLNEHWTQEDGGELRIYLDENNPDKTLDVMPENGTLVVFLSSQFYHEVLPAKRERLSLTGWFKTRGNTAF